jgi:hypothetical protein
MTTHYNSQNLWGTHGIPWYFNPDQAATYAVGDAVNCRQVDVNVGVGRSETRKNLGFLSNCHRTSEKFAERFSFPSLIVTIQSTHHHKMYFSLQNVRISLEYHVEYIGSLDAADPRLRQDLHALLELVRMQIESQSLQKNINKCLLVVSNIFYFP